MGARTAAGAGVDLLLRGRAVSLCAGLLSGSPRAAEELADILGRLGAGPPDGDSLAQARWALKTVPLYETSYDAGRTASGGMTFQMADIAGFYRAFGFEVSGERPDHIVPELEFLALLLVKEAVARMSGDREGAEVCATARGKFMKEHLGAWLPELADKAGQTDGGEGLAALAALVLRLAGRK